MGVVSTVPGLEVAFYAGLAKEVPTSRSGDPGLPGEPQV